jgi:hypothetical protein
MAARKKKTPAARQRSGAQESFLDQPANSIAFPAPGSQCGQIGLVLLGGAILNSSDLAHSQLETTKLTSRISDLIIKFDWLFISKSPATRIKSNGKPQRVTFYSVSADVLRALRRHPKVRAWLAECRKLGGA